MTYTKTCQNPKTIMASLTTPKTTNHDESNRKVIGKMKDECAGVSIAEYIGLRPKLYSVLRSDEQLIKKAKGLKKCVIKKQINFENYKDALFHKKSTNIV